MFHGWLKWLDITIKNSTIALLPQVTGCKYIAIVNGSLNGIHTHHTFHQKHPKPVQPAAYVSKTIHIY